MIGASEYKKLVQFSVNESPTLAPDVLEQRINAIDVEQLSPLLEQCLNTKDDADCSLLAGLIYLKRSNYAKAWEQFSLGYKQQQTNPYLAWFLAMVSEILGKWEIVNELLYISARYFPDYLPLRKAIERFQNFRNMMYVQVGQITLDSRLGKRIKELINSRRPRVIVELGSATGEGSTRVLAESVRTAGIDCHIYAIEAQEETFEKLKTNTAAYPFVSPVHGTILRSLGLTPWHKILADMRRRHCPLLHSFPEEELKAWYEYSVRQVRSLERTGKSIQGNISEDIIDILLIDAGEFFAKQELLTLLDKTDTVILDDVTRAYKNAFNHEFLSSNPDWVCIAHEPDDRNGWSMFSRRRSLRSLAGSMAKRSLEGSGLQRTEKDRSPMVHFVYSGNPRNDATIRAPETITNRVFRFLEKRCPVRYYDWADTTTPCDVASGDIIIGHPHFAPDSMLRRLLASPHAAGYLLLPLHTRYPEYNRYINDVTPLVKKVFAISGPYWTDTIGSSEYAYLENKIVRLDNAIDTDHFPLCKKKFNDIGNRGFFILGRSGKEKGTVELFKLLRGISARVVIAGEYSPEDLNILAGRPETIYIGSIQWNDIEVRNFVTSNCDYFINYSVSDASPTTLLECMSLGLVPITTPQCGYSYPSFLLLSLADEEHNRLVIEQAKLLSNDQLVIMQRDNRRLIEERHTWKKFLEKIWEELQMNFGPEWFDANNGRTLGTASSI